jgi:hypothetical protein
MANSTKHQNTTTWLWWFPPAHWLAEYRAAWLPGDIIARKISIKSSVHSLGHVTSTILDEVVDAAEKCFRVQTSAYKTDSNGFIICSPEKPTIINADLRPLTLHASDK